MRAPPSKEERLEREDTLDPSVSSGAVFNGRGGRAVLPDAQASEMLTPGGADWEEVSNTLDPVGFLDQLDEQLGGLEPCQEARLNARRFFAELDRQMNSFLLGGLVARGQMHREDADQRRLAVKAIGNELRTRIQERCRGLDQDRGTCPSFADRVLDHLVPKCRTISLLFLGLIQRYFGESLSSFEQAFTWFANGDLRLVLPGLVVTTQPSSGNFFLFGEFALMAHDYGIEAGRWWRLANVMIRSQMIFARVYGPADLAGATLVSYAGRDYARHGRPYTRAEIAQLEKEFDGADLDLAAGRHAGQYMPGLCASRTVPRTGK